MNTEYIQRMIARQNQGRNALAAIGQENIAAGIEMLAQRERFRQLAARHENGTAPVAVTGFNLFQTPPEIAARMAELVREAMPDHGGRILEPSAGLGRLYVPLSELSADWLLIEEHRELCAALRKAVAGAPAPVQRDFLSMGRAEIGQFDAVIMNPPFKQGRDVKHILHALDMVKPGGRLVSLCYDGTRQNRDLCPIADQWEVLPEGSFKTEGTGASVALLVIDKPLG
jgi:protein-L-isoaspartate O-methyltransferase